MGHEPWPYERGDPCSNCWGPGKTFGDFATPKKVIATFEGLLPQGGFWECPPNGSWILEQFPGWPCDYYGTWDITCVGFPQELNISYIIRGDTSHLWAVWRDSIVWFEEDDPNVLCNVSFKNLDPLIGGTGEVT